MENGKMIIARDVSYSLNTKETQLNNNVMVVGASGAGKTRSIVSPNILNASGSYIISDPKGNLYNKYKDYLISKGYVVKKLDFTRPMQSARYNFLSYIREPIDIIKAAHMLAYVEGNSIIDPFWDQSSEMLLSALIAYLIEFVEPERQNFRSIMTLLQLGRADEYSSSSKTCLDIMVENAAKRCPNSWAVNQYRNVRTAPEKTFNCILISILTKIRSLTSEEITYLTSGDDINISSIGRRKTALFVVVSDTDRSMDVLANLFFTQAMNELCRYADNECANNELPVPVRFILDDFATNCKIGEFPRMIASIRSRGISAMLLLQAEGQMTSYYGSDDKTIIGNCDTYVYMGGNDVDTAKAIAERCNLPFQKLLEMPVGSSYIFRRGGTFRRGVNVDLNEYVPAPSCPAIPPI